MAQAVSNPERAKFYFPELDGLRFVAFLLVFIHHAPAFGPPAWRFLHEFGWIGVDLFFALSAFLFVKLLSKEFERTGTICIWKFYVRRGLRIWPIYALYCLFVMAWAAAAGEVRFCSWRGLGLLTFTDNVLSALRGYNPIAFTEHLWTISYEEQFYLFIPLLLLFLFRSSRARDAEFLGGLAAGFLVVRAALIWLRVPHPAIWVLPVTHFESILLGIVVGLGGLDRILARVPALPVLAAGLLCGWLMTRMGSVETIGWSLMVSYALIGLCTSLVLYFVFRTGKARGMKWLAFGPFVFLGKISYGLYLFHLLGLALGRQFVRHWLPRSHLPLSEAAATFVVSLGLTIAVASVSYLVVEKPFLKLKKRYEIIPSRPV